MLIDESYESLLLDSWPRAEATEPVFVGDCCLGGETDFPGGPQTPAVGGGRQQETVKVAGEEAARVGMNSASRRHTATGGRCWMVKTLGGS